MVVINVDSDNFKVEVLNSPIPVIIDFWAPWCVPCQMMGPVFKDLSKDYEGKLMFAKVNTENDMGISTKFDISGIPCLIIVDKGREIDRIIGFAPKEVLRKKIDLILGRLI